VTAAEILVHELRSRGVDWIATLCGHGLDPLLHAAHVAGMRLVDVRNEQTCAYMAEAFGRLTGRPGVCAVSSGVAHLNALTGVANAWFDRAPMLLISGAGAHRTAGMGHFQDMDQTALARPITRYSRTIDHPARTLAILGEAMVSATTGPPGPVHLMFPMDVQQSEVSDAEIVSPAPVPADEAPPGAIDLDAIAGALMAAESPLVIAGSGVFYDGEAAAMLRFCEASQIPVVVPIWDRGTIDRPSPVFMGVIGAATGGPAILSEADCILLAGAPADYRIGYLQPPAIGANACIFSMRGCWDKLPVRAHEAWLAQCVTRYEGFHRRVRERAREQSGGNLHASHLVDAIAEILPRNPVVLADGGSIGQWAHHLLCHDRYPGDWLTCGRSGVVGWGIGGAMAARLAFPRRPVILLSGDGAFTFNVAEIECAVRQNLGFVAIVADDEGWGITRAGHIRQFGEAVASSLGPIAFDRLAESLGARGMRATTPAAVRACLAKALDEPGVTVIHAPITGGNP
jgi:acetolactate synthase-1/2/3 large subunit